MEYDRKKHMKYVDKSKGRLCVIDVTRCFETPNFTGEMKKRSFPFCHIGDADGIKNIWDIRIQISPYLKDIIDKLYFFMFDVIGFTMAAVSVTSGYFKLQLQ